MKVVRGNSWSVVGKICEKVKRLVLSLEQKTDNNSYDVANKCDDAGNKQKQI